MAISSSSSIRLRDSSNKENVPPCCPLRSPGDKKGRWRRRRRIPLADITNLFAPPAVDADLMTELPVAQQLHRPSAAPDVGSQLLPRCSASEAAATTAAAALKRKSADAISEKSNSLRKGFR